MSKGRVLLNKKGNKLKLTLTSFTSALSGLSAVAGNLLAPKRAEAKEKDFKSPIFIGRCRYLPNSVSTKGISSVSIK